MLKQCVSFFVGFGGGYKSNIHAVHFSYFVSVNFGENGVFFNTHGVITPAIKTSVGHTLKVARTWQRQVYETVQKLVHNPFSQSYFAANGHTIAQLKV